MSGESDSMSHNSIPAYLEECFTEAVFAAAQLKTQLWGNRGNPEAYLAIFYKAFLQLHSMTFYRLNQKGVLIDSKLQKDTRAWFECMLPSSKLSEREAAVKKFAAEGISLFNQWSESLQKHSIIKVGA